jgi:hypothetical protein
MEAASKEEQCFVFGSKHLEGRSDGETRCFCLVLSWMKVEPRICILEF